MFYCTCVCMAIIAVRCYFVSQFAFIAIIECKIRVKNLAGYVQEMLDCYLVFNHSKANVLGMWPKS